MTKEEYLANNGEAWEYSNTLRVVPYGDALIALEAYTKQQTIAFLKWRDSKPGNPQDGSVWWWGLSEEQQYNQFLEHQKQNNQ